MNPHTSLKPIGLAFLLGAGCATQPSAEDPLKNTKKLVVEGHATLYNNGAFQIPATTMHVIPPGPSALDLALELAGVRAAQSFQLSLQHARESVDFTKAGVEKSLSIAQSINTVTNTTAQGEREFTLRGARYAAEAPATTRSIAAASLEYAASAYHATRDAGQATAQSSLEGGAAMRAGSREFAARHLRSETHEAGTSAAIGAKRAQQHATYAWEKFVKGYAAAPRKLGARVDAVKSETTLQKFVDGFRRSEKWRQTASAPFTDIWVDTTDTYGQNVKQSFKNAGEEMTKGAQDTGYTLAALKSLRWVLQGILWEATIKPVGRVTAASLGYITVNAVAYPALITFNEGAAVANIAVQVAWNSAGAVYDITAPSAVAALTALYGTVEFTAIEAYSGARAVVGTAVAGGALVGGQAVGTATSIGGYTAGKSIQYVGAPLAAVGVASTGTVIGVVAGGLKATEGALAVTGGVAAEAVTQVTGKTAAVAVGATGTAISVAAGGAMGAYELSKAVIAPVGYQLGGGLVLSYGTLSQLSAQTVLAVSDAAYVVLSLEGPNWVLYAVRGKLDRGEQLPTGTLLDLQAMQNAGEEFYAVPASPDEVKRVVEQTYPNLPQADLGLPPPAE